MTINELLHDVNVLKISGDTTADIKNLCFDSRQACDGTMFFAVKGTKTDGHDFIDEVKDKGAKAIVCERMPENLSENVCYLLVESSSKALGYIASNFYGNPSQRLKLVGVTGTNGKTSTATLLYRLFRALGHKSGLLSTIAVYLDNEKRETTHTTPDALQINRLLHEMTELGCEYCFMEVSSHAVMQNRIDGLRFAGGIFTNITHDHLDYHKTFAEYIRAKQIFFDLLPSTAFALANIDDRNGKIMVQNTKAAVKTFALSSPADFMCKILEHSFAGMQLRIDGTEMWTRFMGRFSAYNMLGVYAAAIFLAADKTETLTALSAMPPVTGRFESLPLPSGAVAIVDYAHTPDALLNVLNTINEIREDNSKLITVVGCGGNRDKTKRPEMARIAVENSDRAILTSDNPRFERPDDIIDDMKAGLDTAQLAKTLCITNRREAIKTALMLAGKGDIILVAGKGHEDYQEVEGVKHHFDDKEEIMLIANAATM
jgi:UDP-N-acetylmuramoyl-L-alanyl-D-glutamate--2,6-diaminopimelate ligase